MSEPTDYRHVDPLRHLERVHVEIRQGGWCAACDNPWPCDDVRVARGLRAVLALHEFDPARLGYSCDGCRLCQRPWPCPTVAAVREALRDEARR